MSEQCKTSTVDWGAFFSSAVTHQGIEGTGPAVRTRSVDSRRRPRTIMAEPDTAGGHDHDDNPGYQMCACGGSHG